MPRMPNYITVPAVIAKADIAAYAALQGKANQRSVELHGHGYPPGSLRFVAFAGARADDGLYHGTYQFEAGDFQGAESADLSVLLSPPKPGTPKRPLKPTTPSGEETHG